MEALTSTEYNDVTGCVTVNVVDALMAIANAIHRLAAAHEKADARQEVFEQAMREAREAGGPGHA